MTRLEVFKVESASRPGLVHTVRLWKNGGDCTCESFELGHVNPCRHIRIARIRQAKSRQAA
jgi:hypothetical protein